MTDVRIKDEDLRKAATDGMDAFIKVFVDGTYTAIGGDLTAENMEGLNTDQLTLLAYDMIRREVMDGGFVQLIHNGYGGFVFLNPVARVFKTVWNMAELGKLLYDAGHAYRKCHAEIERECTDDEFMAMFELHPEFDDMDDEFVENEEQWTEQVARYVDEHIDKFAVIDGQ